MVFITFDGEECGCTGFKHYVFQQPLFPLSRTVQVLNIDQIGEGAWLERHSRRSSGRRDDDCEVDGEVFARRGIPARSLVGHNRYYHSPLDTVDKVNFTKAFAVTSRAHDILWRQVQR